MKAKLLIAVQAICLTARTAIAANKVSLDEARKIALARVPGTIVHEKLKHAKHAKRDKPDKQGAHDHYNIKIKPRDRARGDLVKKLEIDAETGQILEVKDVKPKSYD